MQVYPDQNDPLSCEDTVVSVQVSRVLKDRIAYILSKRKTSLEAVLTEILERYFPALEIPRQPVSERADDKNASMLTTIRDVLADQGRLSVSVSEIHDDQDLYKVGLNSFALVQVMLELEDRFNVKFPDKEMKRCSFSSISKIHRGLVGLDPSP